MATPIPPNEARFGHDDVVRATGAIARGPRLAAETTGVSIDSRALREGALYVALRGARLDGHAFVADAVARGARAVLVEEDVVAPGVTAFVVPDTARALRELARDHRLRARAAVVALTGSAGKTTTKELLAAALGASGAHVAATIGNLNNLVGVPMTLFTVDAACDYAVVECGTSAPGEIGELTRVVAPDVALVLLASLAHAEGIGSIDAIADEKASLADGLRPSGFAVVNADDPRLVARLARRQLARTLSFGADAAADVRVLAVEPTSLGFGSRLRYGIAGRELTLEVALAGRHAASNVGAVLAVALGLGLDVDAVGAALSGVGPAPGRFCPIALRDGSVVVDDTYNANPASMHAAIDAARALAAARDLPLALVLGDMNELGASSDDAHAELVRRVRDARPATFVAVGEKLGRAADALRETATPFVCFDATSRAADHCAEQVELRALWLVKGSRSLGLEAVVETLVASRGGRAP